MTTVNAKRIRRALVAAMGVVLLLAAALLVFAETAVIALRTEHGRAWLRDQIVRRAHDTVPGLAIGRIDGDYLHTLVVRDVTLFDSDHQAAVHVDRIAVSYRLWSFLRKHVDVQTLDVDGVALDARRDEAGHLNLSTLVQSPPSQAQPKDKQPSRWHVDVAQARLFGRASLADAGRDSYDEGAFHGDLSLNFRGDFSQITIKEFAAMAEVDRKPWGISLRGLAATDATSIHAVIETLTIASPFNNEPITVAASAGGPKSNVGVKVDIHGPGAAVTSLHGDADIGQAGVGAYRVALVLSALNPRDIAPQNPKGALSARLDMSGIGVPLAAASRSSLHFVILPSNLSLGQPLTIEGIDAHAMTDGDAWNANVAGVIDSLTVHATGHGDSHNVFGDVMVITSSQGLKKVPLAKMHGTGTLRLIVEGDPNAQMRATAKVNGRNLAMGESSIGRVDGHANLTMDIARLRRGATNALPRGDTVLTASNVRLDKAHPAIDTVLITLASNAHGATVGGSARGDGLDVAWAMNAEAIRKGFQLDMRSLKLELTRPWPRESLHIAAPFRVDVNPGRIVSVHGLSIVSKGVLVAGGAKFDGSYAWPRRRNDLPEATAKLQLIDFAWHGFDPVQMDAKVALQKSRITGVIAVSAAQNSALHMDMDVPLVRTHAGALAVAPNGPLTTHVQSQNLRLASLPLVRKQLARQGISDGSLALDLAIDGTVTEPRARGKIDVADLELRSVTGSGRDSVLKTLNGIGAQFSFETSAKDVQARAAISLQHAELLNVRVRTSVPPAAIIVQPARLKEAPFSIEARIPAFALTSLRSLDDRFDQTDGVMKATVSISGTPLAPVGHADITVENAHVDNVAFGPIQAVVDARPTRATATVNIAQKNGGHLKATADVKRDNQTFTSDLEVKGVDPSFVRLFTSGVRELSGVVDANVSAHGALKAPVIAGDLYYYRGRLGLVGQPTFHDIGLTAHVQPGKIEIKKMEAYSGGGSLKGTAWMALDGFSPQHLVVTAHADRFAVAAAGSTGARLDGDLAVEGALQQSIVSGAVKVPQATVWLSQMLPSGRKLQKMGGHDDVRFVDDTARAAEDKQAEAAAKPGPARVLDLRAMAGTVYVRGKDIDLELESHLHVTGSLNGQPLVNGSIQIRHGRINVSGERFDFDRGLISFDGTPNPQLDLRITHQYTDALVVIEIRGTPAKPQLQLTSDPAIYDRAQIISLILTGQPGGAPSSGSFDASSAVATAVLGKLADKIAPEIGLDVLRVENVKETTADGSPTSATDTRVEVGKYISRRVYLSYAHVFGANLNQNSNEAQVEYHLSRRWLVETVFGDAGAGGVDALWSYRY